MIYPVCLLAFLLTKQLIKQLNFFLIIIVTLKLQKKILRNFLNSQLQEHILFDGNYYDQIDGVAMGLPLGPVLDNLFTKSNG